MATGARVDMDGIFRAEEKELLVKVCECAAALSQNGYGALANVFGLLLVLLTGGERGWYEGRDDAAYSASCTT